MKKRMKCPNCGRNWVFHSRPGGDHRCAYCLEQLNPNWEELEEVQEETIQEILRKLDERHRSKWTISRSLQDLAEEDPAVRERALAALDKLGMSKRQVFDRLCEELPEHDTGDMDVDQNDRRTAVALALGNLGLIEAIPHLLENLARASDRLAPAIVTALLRLQPGKYRDEVDFWGQMLRDKQQVVARHHAVTCVFRSGDQRAGGILAEVLPELLQDTDSYAAGLAIYYLGEIKEQRAISPLIRALEHKNPDIRSGAADALATLGPAALAAVPMLTKLLKCEAWPEVTKAVQHAIERIQDQPDWAKVFEDVLWSVERSHVIRELHLSSGIESLSAHGPGIAPYLISVTKSERYRPRGWPFWALVCGALANVGSDEGVAAMTDLKNDEKACKHAREYAEMALAGEWPPDSVNTRVEQPR